MGAIMIQGTDIQIKEYRGKRVVTFKDIDTVHHRPIGTASRNFNQNRQHFISGVDYFKVSIDEFRRLGTDDKYNYPKGVTFITESGYLMLVKSFTDDLAWKVQRELVDTYFRIRAEPEVIEQTVTLTESIPREKPDIYLEASRIMSGCLEGNRPYVLNILRHIVPDVDQLEVQQKVTEVKTEVKGLQDGKRSFFRLGVDIDTHKLAVTMAQKNLSKYEVAKRAQVCVNTVEGWLNGEHKPVLQNRINLCMAIGEDEDYLTPRRSRRRQ